MSCDDFDEYLDGALSGSRLAEFEAHLARCPACTAARRQQLRLDRALAAAASHLPPASARLRERFDRHVQVLESRRKVPSGWKFAAAVLIVGAGIGLAVGLGSLIDGDGGSTEQARGGPEQEVTAGPTVTRLVPEPEPTATVVLDGDVRSVAVPVRSENANATIVFVYPVFDGGAVQDGAR